MVKLGKDSDEHNRESLLYLEKLLQVENANLTLDEIYYQLLMFKGKGYTWVDRMLNVLMSTGRAEEIDGVFKWKK